MLYPQRNFNRQFIDLSGIWDFRLDPDDKGVRDKWAEGFNKGTPIVVPASWNDQFADNRDFLGPAWYQFKFKNLSRSKDYVIGEHVWNLCDFKTSQGILRMGSMNHKGVFTRDRRPKMAAHLLRKLWKKKE